MNIQELHAELSKEIEAGNGELPVVLECDHGQTPVESSWSGTSKVIDMGDYLMDLVNEDDPEWEHEGDPVYLIQAY